jgi:putative cardiolipin synthase
MEEDMRPENSWVIGRRTLPLGLEASTDCSTGCYRWARSTSGPSRIRAALSCVAGATPVSPEDPAFHDRYREVGSFPGTDGLLSTKEILTRLYKVVGAPLTPVL